MNASTRWAAMAAGILLAPAIATAQLFKCTQPDGKIVYSDARCEASAAGSLKVTPMGTTPSERERSEAAARAEAAKAGGTSASAPAPASGAGAAPGGRYQLTSADRDRLRDLEINLGRLGASDEQKTAASLEMSSIRSGQDARMSADHRSRRDSLHVDLSSADVKKRRATLNALRELYSQN